MSGLRGYHATWRPELFLLPPRPAGDPVEPQWFGADLDSQLGRSPAVFMDQSETWQYVAGRISTKDWGMAVGLDIRYISHES